MFLISWQQMAERDGIMSWPLSLWIKSKLSSSWEMKKEYVGQRFTWNCTQHYNHLYGVKIVTNGTASIKVQAVEYTCKGQSTMYWLAIAFINVAKLSLNFKFINHKDAYLIFMNLKCLKIKSLPKSMTSTFLKNIW